MAISCLIFAALMILITKVPVALAMARLDKHYDNKTPRQQQSRLQGFGQRALGAHQNAIEAFPLFAAGLAVALWAQADSHTINLLALIFVVARLAYTVCYWVDWDKLRSIVWFVALVCCYWLMALALPI